MKNCADLNDMKWINTRHTYLIELGSFLYRMQLWENGENEFENSLKFSQNAQFELCDKFIQLANGSGKLIQIKSFKRFNTDQF